MSKLLPLLVVIILLSSCSKETTVQVIRHPLIQFTADSVVWTATSHSFTKPVQVVAYPANSSQSGQLYNRFIFQVNAKNEKGEDMQLNIVFDAFSPTELKGVYSPTYTSLAGLYDVQLFRLDNNLSAYSLCAGSPAATLHIQRQSQRERLISGNFQVTLCNVRDATERIHITDGIIKDIKY